MAKLNIYIYLLIKWSEEKNEEWKKEREKWKEKKKYKQKGI